VAEAETATEESSLQDLIGQSAGTSRVVVERGPIAIFAEAVLDEDPVYYDAGTAEGAGFSGIPAPPTFPFVMDHWGKFRELQESDAPPPNPLGAALGPLVAKGGLILHGEQEFVYHRPVVVGDVLLGEGRVLDAYQKESRGRTMTFVVIETNWTDESGAPVVTTRFNIIHRS
jgi:acyl dehydratase